MSFPFYHIRFVKEAVEFILRQMWKLDCCLVIQDLELSKSLRGDKIVVAKVHFPHKNRNGPILR